MDWATVLISIGASLFVNLLLVHWRMVPRGAAPQKAPRKRWVISRTSMHQKLSIGVYDRHHGYEGSAVHIAVIDPMRGDWREQLLEAEQRAEAVAAQLNDAGLTS